MCICRCPPWYTMSQSVVPSGRLSIFSALSSQFFPRPQRTSCCLHLRLDSQGSSPFTITIPSSGINFSISVFALNTPSRSWRNSKWAWPITVKTAIVGLAIPASSLISPKPEIPISTTAAWCSGSMRDRVIGTPIWLLRFPSVLSTFSF